MDIWQFVVEILHFWLKLDNLDQKALETKLKMANGQQGMSIVIVALGM